MRWRGDVFEAMICEYTPGDSEDAPTIILPLVGNLAQLRYAIELSIEVQYVLAVEALAGLDEVEVTLHKLPRLHNMVLGALELPCISTAPHAPSICDAQSYAPA